MFGKPGRKARMMGWEALMETRISDDGLLASCRMEKISESYLHRQKRKSDREWQDHE